MPLSTEVDYNNVVIKGTVELGVKGERGLQGFKGDQGPPVPVAHELGDDPDLAVSQKLLTDSIADMEQSNEAAVTEATHQAGLAGDSAGIAASRAGESEQSAQTAGQYASTATEQAGIATTKAREASDSEVEATRQAGLASDSAGAAEQAATIATTKAGEASQSAQAAAQSATQAEETLDDKLNKPPLDGVLYGVRNGVFVPIMAGSTTQA